MVIKKVEVSLEGGLEARKIALLVQLACQYDGDIYISIDGKKANAKSIMGVISLGIGTGEIVEISAEGHDELEAAAALERFLIEGTV